MKRLGHTCWGTSCRHTVIKLQRVHILNLLPYSCCVSDETSNATGSNRVTWHRRFRYIAGNKWITRYFLHRTIHRWLCLATNYSSMCYSLLAALHQCFHFHNFCNIPLVLSFIIAFKKHLNVSEQINCEFVYYFKYYSPFKNWQCHLLIIQLSTLFVKHTF